MKRRPVSPSRERCSLAWMNPGRWAMILALFFHEARNRSFSSDGTVNTLIMVTSSQGRAMSCKLLCNRLS
jgi:hypothetical protein